MYFAIGVEPTKDTAWMPGWCRIASTASLSPCTTLKTPSGSPASFSSSAIMMPADGSFSDGLRMKVFPHTSASGNIHIGTIAGKLNGVIPAQTPTGSSREYASTPRPTDSECEPFSRCGAPAANSTTSMPRWTSPMASRNTLPCSSLITVASAFWSRSISSRNRVMIRARRSGGRARQAGNAAVAAATAASMSRASANGTDRTTRPLLRWSPRPVACSVGRWRGR